MLQQLDSAIAFAVIMLTLSLIITAVVQVVLASFDVRGMNLVWALTRLFHQADPEFAKAIGKRKSILGIPYELFKPTKGRRLAQAVSRYKPLVSGIVGRAKAIRSDELLLVLKQISDNPPANLPTEAHEILKKLLNERVPGSSAQIQNAAALAGAISDKIDPGLRDQLRIRIDDAVKAAVGTVSKVEQQVNRWFDVVMDRSSEIFSAHGKIYTFGFAILLCFGWHIDSGQIYHQISSNIDVRDNLNHAADSIMEQGNKLLGSNHVTATFNEFSTNSKNMAATLNDTSKISCEDNGAAWLAASTSQLRPYEHDVQQSISSACKSNRDHPDFGTSFKPTLDKVAKLAPVWAAAPSDSSRCSQGTHWADSRPEFKDAGMDAVSEFQQECQRNAQLALSGVGDDIVGLRKTLDDSKLQFATTVLRYDGKEVNLKPFHLTGYGYWPHLVGTLATVLLLSLGAPFWFNTLRGLSNLKPVVAQKIEQEGSADGVAEETSPTPKGSAQTAGASGD